MRHLFFAVMLTVFLSAPGFASLASVYISQSGGGAGTSCGSPFAASFFNASGNWGATAAQIGPDTVVHLCGTITTALTWQGDGTSGHPIVVDGSGATLNNKVTVSSHSYFTLQNTTCATNYSATTQWITLDNAQHGTVQGNTCDSFVSNTSDGDVLFMQNASGMSDDVDIKNNRFGNSTVSTNIQSDIIATEGATNITIEGNLITQRNPDNAQHNDGIQVFCKNAGSNCPNGRPANWTIRYNTIVLNTPATNNKSFCMMEFIGTGFINVYGNIFLGIAGSSSANGVVFDSNTAGMTVNFINNTIAQYSGGPNNLLNLSGSGAYNLTGNIVYNTSAGNALTGGAAGIVRSKNIWGGTNLPSCASTTDSCSGTTANLFTNFAAFDVTLKSGAAAIAFAPNSGTTYNGYPIAGTTWPNPTLGTRPGAGNWDAGAYQFATGTPAPIATLTASLGFGNQNVNSTSAAQTATLRNDGDANLTYSNITTSAMFGLLATSPYTCGTSGTLIPGNSCTVGVTFTPTSTGLKSGTVTVTDNASGSPHTVALSGTGQNPPVVSLTSSLAFGNQPTNTTSAAQTAQLSNTGGSVLNITSITPSAMFAVLASAPYTCGTSGTLGAGTSCTVGVTFTPTSTGLKSGTVSVVDNAAGSPHVVALSGTGILPNPFVCPTSVCLSGYFVVTGSFQGASLSLACGPPAYNCSTHSTGIAALPALPAMGGLTGVNTTGYSYSAPTDFFYPSSGTGNCITRLTDANSRIRSGQPTGDTFAPSWGGGGNDLMWSTNRSYGAIQSSEGGGTLYLHVSYDGNGCMHNDTTTITATSLGGSTGGFSFSRVTPNVAYHMDGNSGNGTTLYEETLSGTNPITVTRTPIFDYNNCPGVDGTQSSQGGNSALGVSSDDRYFGTGINFPPATSGQGGAHWVLVWDRQTNSCATWYTGEVNSAELPHRTTGIGDGNEWAFCNGNCSRGGSNPDPIALNISCAQPGFGIHGVQMAHDGQYINASGPCNGNVNSSNKWHIGSNGVETCNGSALPADPDYYDCGGHGSAAYSTMYYSNRSISVRPMADVTAWTAIHDTLNLDFHGSEQWVGAAADTNPWLVSTLEDLPGVFCTGQPWCFELLAIRHDGIISRFSPNYHVIQTGNDLGPVSVMTPDGYCMIFSSSWNDTLGLALSGKPRKDLFSICNLQ